MKIVRTPEEIKSMLNVFTEPAFLESRTLAAMFETTPEFISGVLPPPLEPASLPHGSIFVQTSRVFKGAGIFVNARYGDVEGSYCLAMPMNTDYAILFGRELWGEPKKQADTELTRDGDNLVGTVIRRGVEVIRLTGKSAGPIEMETSQSNHFHFKYSFSADGSGLDHNPRLVHVRFNNKVHLAESCQVTVELKDSDHDIYGQIPIVSVLGGVYTEMDCYGRGRYLAEVDKEKFLPYAFSKIDAYDSFL